MTGENSLHDLNWLRQAASFASSRIILTANNYRIFDLLEKGSKTSGAVARALSSDRRATELLLDSLVSLTLLKKTGTLYKNRPVASKYLVSGKPGYQGDILRHYHTMWENWSGLDTTLKTGKPCKKSHDHEAFILGMHNLASQKVRKVMDTLNLAGIHRLIDIGGGPGTYSIAFAKKKIEVTLMDSPDTLRIAGKVIRKSGMQKHIQLLPGDFTKDEIGNNYDMVFISQIFHAYSEKACNALLKKGIAALNPGGRVVVHEFYLDETKTHPPAGAIFSINMLVNTPQGRTYTKGEICSWMRKAGLADIRSSVLDETVVIAGTRKA